MSKKLNLNELEVTSFVTEAGLHFVETVKGGKQVVRSFRGECIPTDPSTDPVDHPSRGALDCSAFAPFVCVSGISCNL